MPRWFFGLVLIVACSHKAAQHGDAAAAQDGTPSDGTVDAPIDAHADAAPDAAPTCSDLAPVSTDLACPTTCPTLTCVCANGSTTQFTAPCTAHGCVEGLRCSTVCAIDATTCAIAPTFWQTSHADLIATIHGSTIVAMRFLPGGDLVGVGQYVSDVNVGGTALTSASGGGIVFRLHRDGTAVWVRDLGSTLRPQDVRVASNGDLEVLAWGAGNVDLGNGVTVPASTSTNGAFLMRFDANNVALWATMLATGDTIYLAMQFSIGGADLAVAELQVAGVVSFNGQSTASSGFLDTGYVAIDSAGGYQWFHRYPATSPSGIAITSTGNIVASIYANQPIDFGSGPLTHGVLLGLTSTGSVRYATATYGTGSTYALVLDLAAVGDKVAAVGSCSGAQASLGFSALGCDTYDDFAAQIDDTGHVVWLTMIPDLNGSALQHVAALSSGAVTVMWRSSPTWSRIEGHDLFMVQGYSSVVQLDAQGHYVRERNFGGDDSMATRSSIDAASDGSAVLAGSFYGPAHHPDFGAGPWDAPAAIGNTTPAVGFYALLVP